MSRCRACNIKLSRRELKHKDPDGKFTDLCNRCLYWDRNSVSQSIRETDEEDSPIVVSDSEEVVRYEDGYIRTEL